MKVPKKITTRMLVRMGACVGGVCDFATVFDGRSAAFTPGNIYYYESHKWSIGLGFLLRELSPADHAEANKSYHREAERGGTVFRRAFYAAALCRLARQNLKKKGSKAQ
jgi:hypothetical protein